MKRILLAGAAVATLLAAPAFAQNSMGATPSHTTSETTTTDKMTSDTDAGGKTVTKHHKVVKHHRKASKKATADNGMSNSAQ